MIDVDSVRSKLAAVANNELSLESFEEWIEPASWNMHADSSPEAIDLVSSIHLLMSERDHGDLDEAEFRRAVLALLGDEILVEIAMNVTASVRRVSRVSRFATNSQKVELSHQVRAPA